MSAMANALDGLKQFIERGGWVMWPLLAMSLVALTLIFERAWFWARTHGPASRDRFERLADLLRTGRTSEAKGLAEMDSSAYGDVARRLIRDGASEASAVAAVEQQHARLFRFMPTLGTIITAAPMLGILGTVIGIISSFEVLSAKELASGPSDVGAGIAEALLTTVVGLVIAIVTLFPYNTFRAQIDRAYGRIDLLIAAARNGSDDDDD